MTEQTQKTSAQPLAGVRVMEMGSFITAPYTAMMLADLGADVIKVERPGSGDPFRSFKGGTYSPHFRAYNRSKKSLTLDFSGAAGQDVVKKLAARCDVLIENFRPGAMEKWGLGFAELHALNPRLVYCSITGFGADGPYRDRPSYDTVGQALSGLLSLSVDGDNPQLTGAALSDTVTGLYGATAVLAGLQLRERTGAGSRVETNMLAATTAFVESWFLDYESSGVVPGTTRKSETNHSFALRCGDGKMVALHLSSPPKFWDALLAALDAKELGVDPRFSTRPLRTQNYEALRQELGDRFARRPRSEWVTLLERNDVPFAPVHAIDEVASDPQVQWLELFHELVHPTEGPTQMIKRPVWIDGDAAVESAFAPPRLGEHTDDILRELGYSDSEIESAHAAGTV